VRVRTGQPGGPARGAGAVRRVRKAAYYAKWLTRYAAMMAVALVASIPLRRSRAWDDLWLIAERDNEASDSGYQLYRYILEHHPRVNVRYVLDSASPEYAAMPYKGNVVQPGSLRHYLCDILSTKSLSTYLYGASPGRYFCLLFLPLMRRKTIVCLQHGVTKDSVPHAGLFHGRIVISSPTEKAFYLQSGYRHPAGFLPVGLARFDALVDDSARRERATILVMPTFRSWLEPNHGVADFEASQFFRAWNGFLSDERLREVLERRNLSLIFCLHWKFRPYARYFTPAAPWIEIADPRTSRLRHLKRQCAALITDYSSVFVDFAYLGKPSAFYQFDADRFFSDHHAGGVHPYPFGDYADGPADLVALIDGWAASGFALGPARRAELDQFFYHRDRCNAQRNFDVIAALRP